MQYIDYQIYDGIRNMQIDSDILDNSIITHKKNAVFRLYGWSPACVSLGRNQNDDFLNKEIMNQYGVDCVRRPTGGRAILHDKEITYSFIVPVELLENGENITKSYIEISGILIDIFKNLGIELTIGGRERYIKKTNYCMCVSTGADLCFKGKKFIGSAQYRKSGYILQHGSILLDYNKIMIERIFNTKIDFSHIITLNQINSDLTVFEIISAVKSYITAHGIEYY